jgi:hypothetical protein
MIVKKLAPDAQNQLYNAIDRNLSSVKVRSVSYVIYVFSETMATVSITVTGKKGTVTKQVGISYDALLESWTAYDNNNKYIFSGLGEVKTLVKTIITRQTTVVNKIA